MLHVVQFSCPHLSDTHDHIGIELMRSISMRMSNTFFHLIFFPFSILSECLSAFCSNHLVRIEREEKRWRWRKKHPEQPEHCGLAMGYKSVWKINRNAQWIDFYLAAIFDIPLEPWDIYSTQTGERKTAGIGHFGYIFHSGWSFFLVCVCPCSTTGVQIYRSAISVEAFFAHLNDLCVGFFFAVLWWRVGEKKGKTEPHNRSISENGWTFFLSVLLCIMLLWMGIVLPMNGMYSSVFSDISLHSSQAHLPPLQLYINAYVTVEIPFIISPIQIRTFFIPKWEPSCMFLSSEKWLKFSGSRKCYCRWMPVNPLNGHPFSTR